MTSALAAMTEEQSAFSIPLASILAGEADDIATLDSIYGRELREFMTAGLSRLIARFPSIEDPETRLIGPTLEGVGWYPRVDGNLRLLDVPAWVAGDACGLFRGIVAAMISGHYAASAALRELG
jgi:uncharacterized FAD-dependent dehydrogenase